MLKRIYDKCPEIQAVKDLIVMSVELNDYSYLLCVKGDLEVLLESGELTEEDLIEYDRLYEKVLSVLAPRDLDSYILYMEWGREMEHKFYAPRRERLKEVVSAIQELIDGELELLAISMPPGVGKSTLEMFLLTYLAGQRPDLPNLMFSHSNDVVEGAYKECLRMMNDEEYRYKYIFPGVKIVSTNSRNLRIDLGQAKRFETLEFTSIGSQNAGSYRAMNLLCCDDLVDGFETAMSVDRLNKLWGTYTVDARQRKQGKCKELHIATRWSVNDPIGRLEKMYGGTDKAKFIVVPALNENGESNFDYPFNLGFSTKMYHDQRDSMDEVSWKCLYMNEPIEREGQLYAEEELLRYMSLPSYEPDAVLSVCDTKDKGDDYAAMPVFYQYGDMFYMEDCVFDNGKPEIVDVKLAEMLERHRVHSCRFESNNAGGRVAEEIDKKLREKGIKCQITKKFTISNKETKIVANSAWVKRHVYFKDKSLYRINSDYGKFINNLCSYSMVSKNKHDDAPDSLSMSVFGSI